MSQKCEACGFVNFSSGTVCRRCEDLLAAAPNRQKTFSGTVPFSQERVHGSRLTKRGNTFILGCCLLVLGFVFGFLGMSGQIMVWRCTAATKGVLAQEYTTETTYHYGISGGTTYLVKYSYQVQGRNYQGHDRLSTEPHSTDVLVHYDATNPDYSMIEPQPFAPIYFYPTLGVTILGFFFVIKGLLKK